MEDNYFYNTYGRQSFPKYKRAIFFAFGTLIFLALYGFTIRPPLDFPKKTYFSVKEGWSLGEIAEELEKKNIIQSAFWLKVITKVFGGEKGIIAGNYYFKDSRNLFGIAYALSRGEYSLPSEKITIPEGMTIDEMAEIFEDNLAFFDKKTFLKLTKDKEGYLFPDTYFFLSDAKTADIVKVMEDNFRQKIAGLDKEIQSFGKPLKDVIIMASILEEEARTTETRRVISGILWKRLSVGIPLQVDAPFQYFMGKNTFDLTMDDLAFDSPYNTYLYKGLPEGPISNPGLDSIRSAVTPVKTSYYFYLSDKDGEMHYAKTFDEHVVNKQKYLP